MEVGIIVKRVQAHIRAGVAAVLPACQMLCTYGLLSFSKTVRSVSTEFSLVRVARGEAAVEEVRRRMH